MTTTRRRRLAAGVITGAALIMIGGSAGPARADGSGWNGHNPDKTVFARCASIQGNSKGWWDQQTSNPGVNSSLVQPYEDPSVYCVPIDTTTQQTQASQIQTQQIKSGTQQVVDAIRTFLAPLVLLAISLASLVFLYRREAAEFVQFAALAVGVAIFFYCPYVLDAVATTIGNQF